MSTPATTVAAAPAAPSPRYEFDDAFQQKIVALKIRDFEFNQRTDGLIEPEYFANEFGGVLIKLLNDFWAKYKQIPTSSTLARVLTKARDDKLIRATDLSEVARYIIECRAIDISDRDYVIDEVSTFARHQAVEAAILRSVDFLERRDFGSIEQAVKKALMVGADEKDTAYDFFDETENRKQIRKDELAGIRKPTGITTGVEELDKKLYHRGFGRKELSVVMGPAKSGKSMSLVTFGVNACLAGYNVLFITLEVSAAIIADRVDANISGIEMNNLVNAMGMVEDRINSRRPKAGRFIMHEFGSGTLKPSTVHRLLKRYEAQGILFDEVIIDYADLMAPEMHNKEARENSRTIYVDLRNVAFDMNVALITATQTNREGFKASIGKMEHVAEDINKVRTVDLLISINTSDDERARGEARYHLAASRNQVGGITMRVKTDIAKARAIEKFLEWDS